MSEHKRQWEFHLTGGSGSITVDGVEIADHITGFAIRRNHRSDMEITLIAAPRKLKLDTTDPDVVMIVNPAAPEDKFITDVTGLKGEEIQSELLRIERDD